MIDNLLYQMVIIDKGIDYLSPMINDNRLKEVMEHIETVNSVCNRDEYLLKEYLIHLHCVETNTVHYNVGESHRTLPYGLYLKYHLKNRKLKALISTIVDSGNTKWYRVTNKQFKRASYFNYWFIGKYYEVLLKIIRNEYIDKSLFDVVDKDKLWVLLFSYIYNKGESKSLIYALQTFIRKERKEKILTDGILGKQSKGLFKEHLYSVSINNTEKIKDYIFKYGYGKHTNKNLFALNQHGWKNRLDNAVGIIKIMENNKK